MNTVKRKPSLERGKNSVLPLVPVFSVLGKTGAMYGFYPVKGRIFPPSFSTIAACFCLYLEGKTVFPVPAF
jgi:hypothetical protein